MEILGCLIVVVIAISLPLVLLLCHVAWRLPVLGVPGAIALLAGAAHFVPRGCAVSTFCTPRLDLAVFGFVLGVGVLVGCSALAGLGRVARAYRASHREPFAGHGPSLPRAHALVRRARREP